MSQPTHIVPTLPMARRLARLDPVTRSSPGLAAAALRPEYLLDDIEAGLAEAMLLAERFAQLAASDRPWARALGHARDLLALAVLCGFGTWAWAVLA